MIILSMIICVGSERVFISYFYHISYYFMILFRERENILKTIKKKKVLRGNNFKILLGKTLNCKPMRFPLLHFIC